MVSDWPIFVNLPATAMSWPDDQPFSIQWGVHPSLSPRDKFVTASQMTFTNAFIERELVWVRWRFHIKSNWQLALVHLTNGLAPNCLCLNQSWPSSMSQICTIHQSSMNKIGHQNSRQTVSKQIIIVKTHGTIFKLSYLKIVVIIIIHENAFSSFAKPRLTRLFPNPDGYHRGWGKTG